jgi:signal transduction histidine kinase
LKEALIAGGGRTHSFESLLKTRDGTKFPALISASLLKTKNDSATGIVRYIKNISEIKELEKELRQLSDFKSRHLHNISHEIKTPIATIIGFIDIISKYYEKTLDINVQRYMQKIKSNSQVLLDLMDTLLDLSRIESGKLELKYSSFNPTDILEEVKIIFLPLLSEKGIDFTVNNNCTVTEVTADRARLRQVIFNLVSNAVKYTPESGKVALYLNNDDNNLLIQVNDTGRGIPEENLSKIFDEFFQAAAVGEGGYGLGLALAKHIIDLHGGSIELESKENIGSKFKVTIPLGKID